MQKEITEILKKEGLDIAEEEAVRVVNAAFEIMVLILPKVSETAGVIIGPMIMVLKPRILALLDKIDGQDNPEY